MSTQTETRPVTRQSPERRGEGLEGLGLIHLAACCGGAGAAVLTVILIQWLT